MVEIILKGDPQNLDDVEKNFRPIEVREFDATELECLRLGIAVSHVGSFRVLVAYYVSRVDANKRGHLAKILGDATGAALVTIPCGGDVDWSYVQDIMESRVETIKRRAAERRERLRLRQEALGAQLADVAYEMEQQKKGASTFGYGGAIQRSN